MESRSRPRRQERPSLEDITDNFAALGSQLGETIGKAAGIAMQMLAAIPNTAEAEDLRQRAKDKLRDIAEAL